MADTEAVVEKNEELTKKYKRLETNQKDYAAEAQKEIKRQKAEIAQLQKDNQELRQQVQQAQGSPFGPARASGGKMVQPTGSAGSRIQKVREMEALKDQIATLESKVELEERKLEELNQKIGKKKGEIGQARSEMGGVNITKESNLMIEKQIKVLENRLDKSLIKFNEALHINKELREQIDNLRRERGVFDTIYKKLERELQEKKKEMAFIIEVSNIAYEERDNAQNELAQLKIYASKEMHSFEETFKELDDLLEEDRKMKEAIKQRMAERKDKSDVKSASEDDIKLKKKTPSSAQKMVASPTHSPITTGMEMSPQNYEEAFNKIKAATNMSDINMLVEKFLSSEDNNFSLFNYVNELNNEIEKLEDARNETQAEMERVKGTSGSPGDQNRKNVLKQLEERLQVEEANSKKYQSMADGTSKLLDQIIGLVTKLFNTLECDDQKIAEAQGTAIPSENNIHLYLAAVELRTDEHLLRWRRVQNVPEKGPAFPFGANSIQIDIPNTGDDYNDGFSDEEERVLTREELLRKTNQKISKQQLAGTDWRKGGKKQAKKKTQMFPAAT
jgi:DNA repair exonuclease SbcCD ATPase subunit|eukprot:CAMPEP_0174292344 /NCGR_PEP_ID=MMETSP0809-20121228/35133_1 /TAXON_ID=73025 ORGANISM="Eutreptiella gymnastica-like, Strain CCMP1594" /NCGR_SAMPLE_ID=MMETSP0809 /ASSEMBLY_ACC=CAM_ASM_000658 /LENGTH=560 /DNA_ID=CAMNT_0015392351 /DNA_START=61 /DNA_END=1743 /DNA_ORIENTATION=+